MREQDLRLFITTQATNDRWWMASATGAMTRFVWAIVSLFVVQSAILALAIWPAAVFFQWHLRWEISPWLLRGVLLSAATVPAYLIFAHLLMLLSAISCRLLGWRPQADQTMRIAEYGWPLLDWARYSAVSHVVRLLVGPALKATPMWTWYLRLDGAEIGRGVWVNSLGVTDHCLLRFGDNVVIGAGAHLSGHTAEGGAIKTGTIELGAGTTVGLNSIVGIGVTTGPDCQIGALSFVGKNSKLAGSTTYAGVPATAIAKDSPTESPS
ncbi:MAG: hypothetical protein ACR2QO_15880 [Acidimicrobiales bacterium]